MHSHSVVLRFPHFAFLSACVPMFLFFLISTSPINGRGEDEKICLYNVLIYSPHVCDSIYAAKIFFHLFLFSQKPTYR